MTNLWKFSMNVDLIEHYGYPGYRFTWHVRDAAGQQVTHQAEVDGHMLQTILVPEYLLSMANGAFMQFYKKDQERFNAILERAKIDMTRRYPPLDANLKEINDGPDKT